MLDARVIAIVVPMVIAAVGLRVGRIAAEELTIYQIQYTTDANGASPHGGEVVDCFGGIVTHKFSGFKPKLTLQDPNFPDGWGGIQVKDWTVDLDLFDSVSVGDWVQLTNVQVEEYRGNTLLQYKFGNEANAFVVSTGNDLPPHKLVRPAEIAAPVEDPDEEWYVADHSAEKYEAMRLIVEDLTVTAIDLGKARDNYNLSGPSGDCWATDYMNADRKDLYHPYVHVGAHFEAVSGLLEQYVKNEFDYYQLVTASSADFVPAPPSALMLLGGCLFIISRRSRAGK